MREFYFLGCVMEKEQRTLLKDYLVKRGFIYNLDFKIIKEKSGTFNFWINKSNYDKVTFKEIKEVLK